MSQIIEGIGNRQCILSSSLFSHDNPNQETQSLLSLDCIEDETSLCGVICEPHQMNVADDTCSEDTGDLMVYDDDAGPQHGNIASELIMVMSLFYAMVCTILILANGSDTKLYLLLLGIGTTCFILGMTKYSREPANRPFRLLES